MNAMRSWMHDLADPLRASREVLQARPALRRAGYALAATLFLVGSAIAIWKLPPIESVRWSLLLTVAVMGVPATVVLNTRRFQLSARIIGVNYGAWQSFQITLASMTSNLLPLPGGVVIRALALKRPESSYLQVSGVTLATATLWLAGVLLLASVCLLVLNEHQLAYFLGVTGCVVLIATTIHLRRLGGGVRVLGELALIQSGLVLVDTSRVWFVLLALGVVAVYPQAGILGLASFAGSAAGFAPGGLGVREAIAALLGLWVGLSAASVFIATAVNRIIGMTMIGIMALSLGFMSARERNNDRASESRQS